MTDPAQHPAMPVLIFDGDCGFCRRCVVRIRRWTAGKVECLAQQDPECARRFPGVDRAALVESVHLVEPGGRVSRGAEAVFRAVSVNPRWAWLLRGYERRRWFAAVTEAVYGWVARHRLLVSRLTRPFLRDEA